MKLAKTYLAPAVLLFVTILLWGQAGRGGGQNGGGRGNQNQGQAVSAVNLPPGTVEGRVLSTTGEPLRKVSLTLRPNGRGGGVYSATSANDGSFRFASVEQGNYALMGERTGYVRETLSSPGGQARVIEVVSEKTTSGIELKLTPQSVIAGHVFDEDGDPLQVVNVEVWRYTYPRGRKQLTQVQSGPTNDLGEFRIANLPPGRYYVSATSRRAEPLLAIVDARGGRANRGVRAGGGRGGAVATIEDYVTTYFPNLTDPAGASPLDLVAGSELRGIDIRLRKAQFHRVSGSVTGLPAALPAPEVANAKGKAKGKAAGDPVNGFAPVGPAVFLVLTPRNGQGGRQAGGAQVNADGTFEFAAVAPGSYYIVAQAPGPVQQRVTARVPVDVGSGDVNNIAVRLQPPLSVSGKLSVEGTQPSVRLASLRLNFSPSEPGIGNQNQNGQTQIAEDGTFQATLAADAYMVEAGGLPDGYYLKSVKVAGREMPDTTLDLSYAAGQVEVVLAPAAGDVTGTVQNARGEPAASVQVTAVPASGSLRRDRNKLVTSDASGNFTFHGLPPGDYRIFAWEEVETNAWMDRDFRQPFESQSASVRVQDSATPSVTLRVIERTRSR